jgi:hypothetical protein
MTDMRNFLPFAAIIIYSGMAAAGPADYIGQMPIPVTNPNVEEFVWQEQKGALPPYPLEENLQEFTVDAMGGRFRYFLDTKGIGAGDDNVIRYTLVVRSKSGAENVSHEGLRCSTGEYKLYGYGVRNELKPVRKPTWKPITTRRQDSHRYLLRDQFCDPRLLGRYTPENLLNSLKYGVEGWTGRKK